VGNFEGADLFRRLRTLRATHKNVSWGAITEELADELVRVEAERDREREIRQSMAMGSVEQRKRAMKAEEERDAAVKALGDLLSVAERMIGGDSSLDPEEWYAIRDYCRIKLASLSAADTEPAS
jgi:hypothetical protein